MLHLLLSLSRPKSHLEPPLPLSPLCFSGPSLEVKDIYGNSNATYEALDITFY